MRQTEAKEEGGEGEGAREEDKTLATAEKRIKEAR